MIVCDVHHKQTNWEGFWRTAAFRVVVAKSWLRSKLSMSAISVILRASQTVEIRRLHPQPGPRNNDELGTFVGFRQQDSAKSRHRVGPSPQAQSHACRITPRISARTCSWKPSCREELPTPERRRESSPCPLE